MKVLQVSKLYHPWVGGVERIAQQVAEGVQGRDGITSEVLACQPRGRRQNDNVNEVPVTRAHSFGMFWGMPVSLDFFWLLWQKGRRADVLDMHLPFPLATIGLFLARPRARLVVHYHSDIVRQKWVAWLFRPFLRWCLKRAETILVSSPNLVKNSPVLQNFQDKCRVVPFGVKLEKFERVDQEAVRKLQEKYGEFVLFVGRLGYYKGLPHLLRAARQVDVNFVIIGEGPLEDQLKQQARDLGVDDRVYFLPYQENEALLAFYRAAAVFVLPSLYKSEAFGIVLIEAMASGAPVISTEVGTGTSWVNRHGETGYVVPPADSQALASAVKDLIKGRKKREQFSRAAKKRVNDYFREEDMLEGTVQAYKQ